jgi:uncharacterized membrane protein YwaF
VAAVGRVYGSTAAAHRFSRAFAAAILALQLSVHFYLAMPPRWNIQHSLPLQPSDLADPVAALFVVWAAVYLTWGPGMRPSWHDYRLVVAITMGWAAAVFVLNVRLGANYGYLNRKPSTGSVLDLLGGWPCYLLPEAALVFGIWALMTWPWARSSKQTSRVHRGRPV